MIKIILASNSPRRKEIMTELGLEFEIIPSNYDEKLESDDFSYEKIEELATQKALEVANRVKDSIVIGADTVVIFQGKILGKPKSKEEAFEMLKALSNKTHAVVTSVCGIDTNTNKTKVVSTTSYVTFNQLTDEMINYYINEYKPLDKAGSYGIQELPEGYLNSFEGSFENVVGLDKDAVKNILCDLGYENIKILKSTL